MSGTIPPPPPVGGGVSMDYPPTGFYYTVSLLTSKSANDSRFKEVSGLAVEMGVEEIAEGGENRFKHRVPSGAKYTNLVLKRGLVVTSLPFYQWVQQTIQNNLVQPIVPKTIQVALLNEKGNPLKQWDIINAWPCKWSVSDFNSMEGSIVIESLEMAYQYFQVK